MNRRSFLAGLGLAPVAAAGAVAAAPKAYASGGYVGPLKGYTSGVSFVGERGPEMVVRLEVHEAVKAAMLDFERRQPSIYRRVSSRFA